MPTIIYVRCATLWLFKSCLFLGEIKTDVMVQRIMLNDQMWFDWWQPIDKSVAFRMSKCACEKYQRNSVDIIML